MFFLTSTAQLFTNETIHYILIAAFILCSMIPVIIGMSRLSRMRMLASVILAALNHCEFRISQIEGCQMENLTSVRSLIQEENFPKLTETFAEFERDSQKLFHGRWTTDLRKYLTRQHLLVQSQYRRLAPDTAYQLLAFSLLSSSFFLLFSLTIGASSSISSLPFALLPALTGTLFFFLVYYRSQALNHELDLAMSKMADTASMRLPVFSELAGSAVLIDAFMQYDRRMEKSVTTLEKTVSQLLNEEMVSAVSSSIQTTLQNTVAPAIQQSHQIVAQLAHDVIQRQETGMANLAEQFTNHLTERIARRTEALFNEIDLYMNHLQNTQGELKQSLQVLDTYRQQAAGLDANINQHVHLLAQQQENLLQGLNRMAQAQEQLANTTKELNQLQTGSGNSLATLVGNLGQQMSSFAQSMTQLTKDVRDENRLNQQTVEHLVNKQQKLLSNYENLSQNMVSNSQGMTEQGNQINKQMGQLNDQLNQSIQNFATAMNDGVKSLLEQFDEQLASVSQRLSFTAGEIRDAADYARQNSGNGSLAATENANK